MLIDCKRRGFSLIELMVALLLVILLLAALVPALTSARQISYREQCANNQANIGTAWANYIDANNNSLPLILDQPAWRYGGVHIQAPSYKPHLDYNRPLTQLLPRVTQEAEAVSFFQCPVDSGIVTDHPHMGTGSRTAFEAFGTSYRANVMLLDARLAGIDDVARPVSTSELITPPSQVVLMGDPGWHERYYETGRRADWHSEDGHCNILFLDGSVRYRQVMPRGQASPVVVEPLFIYDRRLPPVEDDAVSAGAASLRPDGLGDMQQRDN